MSESMFSMQFPCKNALCGVCHKVTLQVHVGGAWRCNECGMDPELEIGMAGKRRW